MPLYTFGGATGSSDERSNSRETSNGDDEEDGCGYENNAGSHEDEREEYDEENDEEECFSKKTNRFSPMIVYVETLTGTAFEVRVSQYEAVMSIKDKIQRLEGIPISQQHLIHDNVEMRDEYTLRDYNIQNGSTLRLVLGMRGGPINTRRVPIEDSTIRDIDLLEAKEQLSRKLSTNSNSGQHVTLLVLRNGEQVNFFRVVDRTEDSLSPLSEMSAASCDKNDQLALARGLREEDEDDDDDEDDNEADEEEEEPVKMAVKLANLRMKMHEKKQLMAANKHNRLSNSGKTDHQPSSLTCTNSNNQIEMPVNSNFPNPSLSQTVSNKASIKVNQQPQLSCSKSNRRKLAFNLPSPTLDCTTKNQNDVNTNNLIEKSMHTSYSTSESNVKDSRYLQSEVSGVEERSGLATKSGDEVGRKLRNSSIMPRTSYAVSQIIDPSAEMSYEDSVQDEDGGGQPSFAKSLYTNETCYNPESFSGAIPSDQKQEMQPHQLLKLRSSSIHQQSDAIDSSSKCTHEKQPHEMLQNSCSFNHKRSPSSGKLDDVNYNDDSNTCLPSTSSFVASDVSPWLNPPNKNFDPFKIAQDILEAQSSHAQAPTTASSTSKREKTSATNRLLSLDPSSKKPPLRSKASGHVEAVNDANNFGRKSTTFHGSSGPKGNLYIDTSCSTGAESSPAGKSGGGVSGATKSSSSSSKHYSSKSRNWHQSETTPSPTSRNHPDSAASFRGGRRKSTFYVENLTDLKEIKLFSSILDKAAAKGKLTRISPPQHPSHNPLSHDLLTPAALPPAPGGTSSSSKGKRSGGSNQQGMPPLVRPGLRTPVETKHICSSPANKSSTATERITSLRLAANVGAPVAEVSSGGGGGLLGISTAQAAVVAAGGVAGRLHSATRKKPRCFVCGKKTRIGATYSCRCEGIFCAQHRYAESHGCTFDYKSEGKKLLEHTNPVVTAPKLPKI